MDFFSDIFSYTFLANALAAAVLSGISCGIIGSYVVCRRTVFLSGGVTHASFGGIGLAYFAGFDPMLGAALFAVLSALGIEWASERGRIRQDSAIGIMWSVGMALGIIFIYLTPGYTPDLSSILFGSILTVSKTEVTASAILAAVVVTVFALRGRAVMYVAFDAPFARSQGVRTRAVNGTMAVITALAIVLSIRTVGIVLLISLLTFPAVIADAMTHSFRTMIPLAALFGTAANVLGLVLSYRMNVPASAATIFVLAVSLIIVKVVPLCIKRRT